MVQFTGQSTTHLRKLLTTVIIWIRLSFHYNPSVHHGGCVSSELVHSESYERSTKRVNYCVALCDGSLAIVQSFVTDYGMCYVLFWPLTSSKYLFKMSRVRNTYTLMAVFDRIQLIVQQATDIVTKLIILCRKGNKQFCICVMPNKWEVD